MLNGTYICTSTANNNVKVKGDLYEFIEGKFTKADCSPCYFTYDSLDHFNWQNYAKIKEVK